MDHRQEIGTRDEGGPPPGDTGDLMGEPGPMDGGPGGDPMGEPGHGWWARIQW